MKDVAIVAPCHIQPSKAWVEALHRESASADVIIVDDSDGKITLPGCLEMFGYARQKQELGDELYAMFERFHKSSACKQFGLWLAYKRGYKKVIVIDSDCIVPERFVELHSSLLESGGTACGGWGNPLAGTYLYSRGYPYSQRNWKMGAHMGLWTNELDLYGTDRVGKKDLPKTPDEKYYNQYVRTAAFFPLSGMNVSFNREVIPFMLFLPNFKSDKGEKFSRHDDIWGGYIFQKLMQKKHYALSYGKPFVFHDTVVVPREDAKEERAMIKYEDDFFYFIDSMLDLRPQLKEATAQQVFEYLADTSKLSPGYAIFKDLLPAFALQAKLYADV